MIKVLMIVIRAAITRSVIAPLPPKRNLIPRFTKGGGAQEVMKDALIEEKGRYQDSRKEENFSISQSTL
jgi:hypothetical protein